MVLFQSNLETGRWLFRHRSFLPMVFYPLAVLVIFLDKGLLQSLPEHILAPLALLTSGMGVMVRMLVIGHVPRDTSGRNRKRQKAKSLNTKGVYSIVRHPLYLGNYLMWLGIIIYIGNIWFAIACSLIFWLYYERIMYVEEEFLHEKFGDSYTNWAKDVPAFVPTFRQWKRPELPFAFRRAIRWEYRGIVATLTSMAFIYVLKHFANLHQWHINKFWIGALIFSAVFYLVMRILGKRTKLLDTNDR